MRFLILLFVFSCSGAVAQTVMPNITVTGSGYSGGSGMGPSVSNMMSGSFGPKRAPPRAIALAQLSAATAPFRDVRCAATSPGARATTSSSDQLDRFLAASEVYTALLAARSVWSVYFDSPATIPVKINGKDYKGFRVTYADGGTEVWPVNPAAASSLKILMDPMPNSLKKGSGKVESVVCGVS